jgi:hypothetical protein
MESTSIEPIKVSQVLWQTTKLYLDPPLFLTVELGLGRTRYVIQNKELNINVTGETLENLRKELDRHIVKTWKYYQTCKLKVLIEDIRLGRINYEFLKSLRRPTEWALQAQQRKTKKGQNEWNPYLQQKK